MQCDILKRVTRLESLSPGEPLESFDLPGATTGEIRAFLELSEGKDPWELMNGGLHTRNQLMRMAALQVGDYALEVSLRIPKKTG